jgi:hypothetical protein
MEMAALAVDYSWQYFIKLTLIMLMFWSKCSIPHLEKPAKSTETISNIFVCTCQFVRYTVFIQKCSHNKQTI